MNNEQKIRFKKMVEVNPQLFKHICKIYKISELQGKRIIDGKPVRIEAKYNTPSDRTIRIARELPLTQRAVERIKEKERIIKRDNHTRQDRLNNQRAWEQALSKRTKLIAPVVEADINLIEQAIIIDAERGYSVIALSEIYKKNRWQIQDILNKYDKEEMMYG